MKRPLVWLALLFCAGIIVAGRIKITFSLAYCFALIVLIFSFLSVRNELKFSVFVSCLVFTLGFASFKNYQTLPRCHISRYTYFNHPDTYIIRGFIKNDPLVRGNKTSFIFQTEEITFAHFKRNCCGDILVYVTGRKDLDYGEELLLSGRLYRPFSFGASGRHSYRDYLYNQGIRAIMQVKRTNAAVKLNKYKGLVLKRIALRSKAKMEEIIFKYNSAAAAGILDAMLLGEKRNVPLLVSRAMTKSGTVHILVVSGFNVGIVTFALVLFLKLMQLPKRARFCLVVPLLIFYCFITGASTPVVRATIMAVVFIFGFFLKREPDIYSSLSIAALFILGVSPAQLFDVGFQLSFISVISIVYLYPKLKALLRSDALKIRYLRFFVDSCLVSFSAWLGTMGFIAYYFRIFSPVTVLANLFIVPLATLITLSGFSLIMVGLLFPHLAPFFASACELWVKILLSINALLIKLPGASFRLP